MSSTKIERPIRRNAIPWKNECARKRMARMSVGKREWNMDARKNKRGNERMNELVNEWMIEWQEKRTRGRNIWINGCIKGMNKKWNNEKNKRFNKGTKEQMNKCMNEWMNERKNDCGRRWGFETRFEGNIECPRKITEQNGACFFHQTDGTIIACPLGWWAYDFPNTLLIVDFPANFDCWRVCLVIINTQPLSMTQVIGASSSQCWLRSGAVVSSVLWRTQRFGLGVFSFLLFL